MHLDLYAVLLLTNVSRESVERLMGQHVPLGQVLETELRGLLPCTVLEFLWDATLVHSLDLANPVQVSLDA